MSASREGPFPRLENYEILEVIGEGGMGTVYLAKDLRHDRRVAIKTIRRDFVTPDVVHRFEREIKLTGGLQHPRILPLLDSGVAEGALYYVMQFVEGESLEQRLSREGALPMDEALRIARHVADALDYAHSHGVVHRDIKPANVMLSGGHAFVMDFGIARALAEGNTSLTSTGSSIGTPTYMSPEQVTDSTAVDGRSDIYSLGCVLYEMVAGHPPFTGPTVSSILRQHLTADPPHLQIHRPATPPEVDAVVMRAMQKSPADRFQAARDLVETLQTISGRRGPIEASTGRRRSGFIAIAAYLAGAWGVLAIVERVAAIADLPTWTVPFALVLLLIGFLVVAATALIQATGGRGGAVAGTTDPGATGARRSGQSARHDTGLGALFRWRNVVAGGVLALILWGVVAVVTLVRRSSAGDRAGIDLAAGEPIQTNPARSDAAVEDAGLGPEEGPDGARSAPDTARTPVSAGGPASTGGEASERTSPAAPPRDRAAADPAARREDRTAALTRARENAQTARSDAEAAGARLAPSDPLRRADSLWTRAVEAAANGQASLAAGNFESARIAYGDAGREARQILTARVDSAWRGVDSLRARADPTSAPYALGDSLRERSGEAERGGDLVTALGALRQASHAYTRALPFVELPPPETPTATNSAEPEPPTPSERVQAAMSTLEHAFETEDLAGIQHVWVNLSQSQIEQFRDFFEEGRDFDYGYEIDPASIRTAGDAVDFRVTVHWEYTGPRGDRVSAPPFAQRFRLEASTDRDVLTSL